jgi:hypothetical protein
MSAVQLSAFGQIGVQYRTQYRLGLMRGKYKQLIYKDFIYWHTSCCYKGIRVLMQKQNGRHDSEAIDTQTRHMLKTPPR